MSRWLAYLPPAWREAVEELWRRRLRTGLTLLGLIFGIGAIVAMQAVGEGSRREALRMVASLGLHNLIVEAIHQDEESRKETRQRSFGLSIADAQSALEVVPEAEKYAAEKYIRSHSVFSEFGRSEAHASGVSVGYFDLTSLSLSRGRAFTHEDADSLAAVAVLGHQVAVDLFPSEDPLGKHLKVNHVWLEVVGVLSDRDLEHEKFEGVRIGAESNHIFVPLESAKARFRFEETDDEVDRLLLRIRKPDVLADSAQVLAAVLDQRHAGEEDYRLLVPQQLFNQHQRTQQVFRVVMGAIAGISLIVGGIGIMNIMLANVLERRREIGLLRALGARRQDIVLHFLREAVVTCSAGAVLGLLFGVLAAYVIAVFADWRVAWAPISITLSVGICTLVGIGFGVYPARKASELDPIAALRQD